MTTSLATESWYQLNLGHQRVHFVLDASDAGVASQQQALGILLELSERIPNFNLQTIGFLGSGEVYEARLLRTRAADWFRLNAGRLSVISPVFEAMDGTVRMVVLSQSPVFDLMDWEGTPQLANSLFVPLGDTPITTGSAKQCSTDVDQICHSVRRTVSSVVIRSDSGFPTSWDNPSYQLDHRFQLTAVKGGDYSVRFAIAGPASAVIAECVYDDSEQESICLSVSETAVSEETWSLLTSENESTIVRDCIRSGEFQCPHCGKTHSRSNLTCKVAGEFLHTCVLTGIAREPGSEFALCRVDEQGRVHFRRLSSPVVAISDSLMAIVADGRPQLVEYDADGKAWQPCTRRFEQFCAVERIGAYAIFLR